MYRNLTRQFQALFCVTIYSLGAAEVAADVLDCFVNGDGPVRDATVNVIFSVPKTRTPDKLGASRSAAPMALQEMSVLEETSYTTDRAGKYQLVVPDLDLPDLRVSITIEHPDYLPRQLLGTTIAELEKHPRGIQRRATLKKAYRVSGRVLLPNGKPADGAIVTAASKYRAYSWKFRSNNHYSVASTTKTSATGEFTIVTDASSTLRIAKEGYASLLVDSFDATKQTKLRLVEFRLPESKNVRGRISDQNGRPIPFAIVECLRHFEWNEFDMPLSYAVSAIADKEGNYQLPPLAADEYRLRVNNRVTDARSASRWNERKRERRFSSKQRVKSLIGVPTEQEEQLVEIPIQQVYIENIIKIEKDETVDFSPQDDVRVSVRVVWANPQDDDAITIGLAGMFKQQEWNGRYEKARHNELIHLYAPQGATQGRIKTGLVRFQRGPNKPMELGDVIRLGVIQDDVEGIKIFGPRFANLNIEVKLPEEIRKKRRNGSAVDFLAFYSRNGYRGRWATKQRISLSGKKVSDLHFQCDALAGEEVTFQVVSRFLPKPKVLHEERLMLKPDEERKLVLDLAQLDLRKLRSE